jgi:methylenetetrahydrofolate reductase (NADPH)
MQPADVNAVTWAIFPGQEVVQSTIIEEVSFLSWKVRITSRSFFSLTSDPKRGVLEPSLIYLPHRSQFGRQDEAYSIWQDWAYLYPPASPTRKLLEGIQDDYWLVSVVHHDYKNPDGLENFLLGSPKAT